MKHTHRGLFIGIVSILLLLLVGGGASAGTLQQGIDPEGFDVTLVYIATGVFDPNDGNGQDPLFFQKEIMGRTDEEIEQEEAEAVEFFQQRFGIDVRNDDRVAFMMFVQDPRTHYRAYSITGYDVPDQGWLVRDGGWMMRITDPEGITFGGDLEGLHVPEGSVAVFGDYNIDVTETEPDAEPIVIHYQSAQPIVPTPHGPRSFACEIFHEEWGWGLAQGISFSQVQDDGLQHSNIRNVLTFPGLGISGEAAGT